MYNELIELMSSDNPMEMLVSYQHSFFGIVSLTGFIKQKKRMIRGSNGNRSYRTRKVSVDSKVCACVSPDIMSKKINDQKCYPYHMDHLPKSFYQKALEELNESAEAREIELNKLKELLSADKITAGIEFEEDFLHLFLRYRKYNSSQAFQALKKFVSFRRNFSSIFQSVPEVYCKETPSTKFMSILPYRCPDGCAIVLCELGKWNHNELSIEDVKRIALPPLPFQRIPLH
ncbi:alpha-tocopherol transfer protein-like isoform X2 [Argiope bruennichi]|uniref:alpha-tocopherol transfer protein-like isoform X2 n=1 Tax=Argiope bruennichi TaxID=94029 RepID=UPI0024940AAB|nr:alpha-tocopherol transfer protein-like isoform X2 [Argiope bruennichi]